MSEKKKQVPAKHQSSENEPGVRKIREKKTSGPKNSSPQKKTGVRKNTYQEKKRCHTKKDFMVRIKAEWRQASKQGSCLKQCSDAVRPAAFLTPHRGKRKLVVVADDNHHRKRSTS